MKIRNGFVSNSSSSSFIIDGTNVTCVDIALNMLETLNDENGYKNYETLKNNLQKLEDKDLSIFISACDDIKIVKKDDKIYVDASYHYEWNFDYIDILEEGSNSDIIYSMKNFYFPSYDNKILGKLSDGENVRYPGKWIYSCNECHNRLLELENGIIFCTNCLIDPNGKNIQYLFRDKKIERILKDEN